MMGISRRTLLGWAAGMALGTMASGQAQTPATPAPAQTAPAPAASAGITGTWQGTLHTPDGHSLRLVLKVTKNDKGALQATGYSIDQGGQAIPATSVSFDGGMLKYAIQFLDLSYEGKVSADGNSISGSSTQGGNSLPLVY
jgi:hypothetical protein